MPELPEVEITARRLDAALGRGINRVGGGAGHQHPEELRAAARRAGRPRRSRGSAAGQALVIDVSGGLSLLIHLMSAGRLQLFDKRAGPRDRTSRLLVRIDGGRELRLREFGTRQAAWVKLVETDQVEADESIARLGPEAWPAPPADLRAAAQRSRGRCTPSCATSG